MLMMMLMKMRLEMFAGALTTVLGSAPDLRKWPLTPTLRRAALRVLR